MLVDTDVLIWYLKGNVKAKQALDKLKTFSISSVTHMEIVQGIRNKQELKLWKSFLKEGHIRHILIDQEITLKAIYWTEEFSLSHGILLADSLIAVTADVYGLDLLTGNHKDYKFIPGLKINTFKP